MPPWPEESPPSTSPPTRFRWSAPTRHWPLPRSCSPPPSSPGSPGSPSRSPASRSRSPRPTGYRFPARWIVRPTCPRHRSRDRWAPSGRGDPDPGDPGCVEPEVLEVVELAGFVQEDVHQELAVVHQDPVGVGEPLHPKRRPAAQPLHLQLHLVDDGPDLAGRATAGDHEGVGDPPVSYPHL